MADALRDIAAEHRDDATLAWPVLSRCPPPADEAQRVAQYLCIQSRTPNNIPIWWDGSRWTGPTGSRTEGAHQRGGRTGREVGPATARVKRGSGLVRISTIVDRVLALPDLSRVDVVHGDVRAVAPIPGAVVYFDPPYLHSPRYAETCPRPDVLTVARLWSDAGCRVAVSEGEPLPLDGWTAVRLAGRARKSEWLTVNWPVAVERQLTLPTRGPSVALPSPGAP